MGQHRGSGCGVQLGPEGAVGKKEDGCSVRKGGGAGVYLSISSGTCTWQAARVGLAVCCSAATGHAAKAAAYTV